MYDTIVSWRGMTSYCAAHGLQILDACSSNFYLGSFGLFAGIADRALRLVALLSFGRLTADHNNLAFVIRKPAATITAEPAPSRPPGVTTSR